MHAIVVYSSYYIYNTHAYGYPESRFWNASYVQCTSTEIIVVCACVQQLARDATLRYNIHTNRSNN